MISVRWMPMQVIRPPRFYSKLMRHLFQSGELLGPQITSIHNLAFFLDLVRQAREHIQEGTFRAWKDRMVPILDQNCKQSLKFVLNLIS